MHRQRIEKLRQEYTGQYVSVDTRRPELARFAGVPARVKSINFSGLALVQFQGADRGWYDVELDHLKVIDPPKPEEKVRQKQAKHKPARAEKPAPENSPAEPQPQGEPQEELSRLELARMEKRSQKDADDGKADRQGD